MKVRPLFASSTLMVIEAEEGCYIQRKDIGWQKGRMFIVHKNAIGCYMEVEQTIVDKSGQMMFGFMEGMHG